MSTSVEIVVVKSFFLCVFFIMAVAGNLLVCYAILTKRKLRTVPNYLVFNLAVADFLFALVGMSMIIVTSIAGEWVLGDAACQVSGVANTLFCLSSIWTLTIISVNRYYAVGMPLKYKRLFTNKRVLASIGVVWLFSVVVAIMPVIGWSRIRAGDSFCTIDGRLHMSYSAVLALLAYVAPLVIIGVIYVRIYMILKRHDETLFQRKGGNYATSASNDGSSISEANHNQIVDVSYKTTQPEGRSPHPPSKFEKLRMGSKNGNKLSVVNVSAAASNQKSDSAAVTEANNGAKPDMETPDNSSVKIANESQGNEPETEDKAETSAEDSLDDPSTANKYVEMSKPKKHRKTSQLSVSGIGGRIATTLKGKSKSSKRKKFAKEARITRMLFVVVLVFFICWTPLAVGSILYGLKVDASGFGILNFGITIACLNSACNPIIYAFMSTSFRRAFLDIFCSMKAFLCCDKRKD